MNFALVTAPSLDSSPKIIYWPPGWEGQGPTFAHVSAEGVVPFAANLSGASPDTVREVPSVGSSRNFFRGLIHGIQKAWMIYDLHNDAYNIFKLWVILLHNLQFQVVDLVFWMASKPAFFYSLRSKTNECSWAVCVCLVWHQTPEKKTS